MLDGFQKTEYAIGAINNAEYNLVELGKSDRIRFAYINAGFHDHPSTCGFALVAENLIQNSTDPSSNSKSFIPEWFCNSTPTTPYPWTGDCFHPNETGAQFIADKVVEEFLR